VSAARGLDIAKVYEPAPVEAKWYKTWLEKGYFHSEVDPEKEPYVIMIPPPNVTSFLHMGHALNNTLQDILIRWKRMQGFNAMWMPGTDHAGIATQNVVERQLATENLTRHDLRREKFVERVWEWRNKYGNTITGQLKSLGCSCDWDRERFTMDEGLSDAVFETFVTLYEKGLVYRGNRIINWCPRCQTALADDEVERREIEGNMYWIRYPMAEGEGFVTVATTRPETMLGDTAVAVNPNDPRHKDKVGANVILPLVEKVIPVIGDEDVDMEFGSGALKITPAHDPVDFEIGQRHGLEQVIVIAEDGTMNENAGPYQGMDRFACREQILKDLQEKGLFEAQDGHEHSVGHCYRCKTVVEPYLSEQWFVKMEPLAEPAIEAVRSGRVRFHPPRWEKIYYEWMENIRDWCISRQIWWGHRIPVWQCADCDALTVSKEKPKCQACGKENTVQDEDVLDTWFSSWLWPFSTLGWPEKTPELDYYYPTQTLVTGPDIIFFWVARMIMAGLEMMDEIPYSDVYMNAMIKDDKGRIMSKSLGNVIDPIQMIERFGADAVRFSLIILTTEGQDVKLHETKFEMGRNFANKLWNAARLVMMAVDRLSETAAGEPEPEDRWIIQRCGELATEVTSRLESFRFNEAVQAIYDFTWHEYCDWYLEMMKHRVQDALSPGTGAAAVRTAALVLERIVRLLHPVMPFITEEIWSSLKQVTPAGWNVFEPDRESVMIASWPTPDEPRDDSLHDEMDLLQDVARAIRSIRSDLDLHKKKVNVILSAGADDELQVLDRRKDFVMCMGSAKHVEVGRGLERPSGSATQVVGSVEIFVPLRGLVELDEERAKIEKKLDKARQRETGILKQIENPKFMERARPEIVERQKQNLEEVREHIQTLQRTAEALKE